MYSYLWDRVCSYRRHTQFQGICFPPWNDLKPPKTIFSDLLQSGNHLRPPKQFWGGSTAQGNRLAHAGGTARRRWGNRWANLHEGIPY